MLSGAFNFHTITNFSGSPNAIKTNETIHKHQHIDHQYDENIYIHNVFRTLLDARFLLLPRSRNHEFQWVTKCNKYQ